MAASASRLRPLAAIALREAMGAVARDGPREAGAGILRIRFFDRLLGQREASDVRAAVRALRSIPDVDGDRVAVVGASMGGGSVLAAAPTLVGVRGLVLLAPAPRYPALVHQRLGFLGPLERPLLAMSARMARTLGQIPLTEWTPAHALRHTDVPALIVHGTADRTIPFGLSEQLLAERSGLELLPLPAVGHDELPAALLADPAAWARVRGFLTDVFAVQG